MSWPLEWVSQTSAPLSMQAWRGVEAQHVVSTMRLVDSFEEQALLEQILEQSKPALPASSHSRHYLLTTPFRYRPIHESRFRRAHENGVWYGAETLEAACAEVAYWRWRFIMDSATLIQSELLTEHTFFKAQVDGRALDLTRSPWDAHSDLWSKPNDYTATQEIARQAKNQEVQWIQYSSVRAPGHRCAAVFDVEALSLSDFEATKQTLHCKATRQAVMMVNASTRLSWSF